MYLCLVRQLTRVVGPRKISKGLVLLEHKLSTCTLKHPCTSWLSVLFSHYNALFSTCVASAALILQLLKSAGFCTATEITKTVLEHWSRLHAALAVK